MLMAKFYPTGALPRMPAARYGKEPAMPEHHDITGPVTGVPLPGGGRASVRVPLDSPPSPRWSQAFSARLSRELLGGPSVAHLSLDRAVQGADIVLDGVENRQAERLGDALRVAVDAANRTADTPAPAGNMPRGRRRGDRRGDRPGAGSAAVAAGLPQRLVARRSPRARG